MATTTSKRISTVFMSIMYSCTSERSLQILSPVYKRFLVELFYRKFQQRRVTSYRKYTICSCNMFALSTGASCQIILKVVSHNVSPWGPYQKLVILIMMWCVVVAWQQICIIPTVHTVYNLAIFYYCMCIHNTYSLYIIIIHAHTHNYYTLHVYMPIMIIII